MNDVVTFRVRFRFRVQKKLNINETRYQFSVGQHEVIISPQLPDIPISQSEWLVINAKGFDPESEAREFGRKLKSAIELSSVASRLGIDSGIDVPTAGLGQIVKDHIHRETGEIVRDNVHGIDVFPDDPKVRIFNASLTGSILAQPEPFLSDLTLLIDSSDTLSQNARDIILLLNYSLMRPEPVAQIIFATSAVEMLGQQEKWSADQRRLLEKLSISAVSETIGTADERNEVAAAIRRGLHKIGLRQGVMRLLDALELGPLKKRWDDLYDERSTLVHGLAPKPGADFSDLSFRTVSLCGRILLKVIAKEVAAANSHVDKFYTT